MVDSTNLPNVNINQIATDLNGKMDKDGVNATASVCIESWHEGTEWYRVYSDGWCEQGGYVGGATTVTFLKPFSNTNYYMNSSNNANSSDVGSYIINRTTTTADINNAVGGAYWEAKGYIR